MAKEDTNSSKKGWNKQTVKIAAGLILAAGIGLGFFFYQGNYAVASTIYLNGNSGIVIKLNQKEKVLEINAEDTAVQAVIDEKDFQGSNLDVAIDALLHSMWQSGYFSDDVISIHVESKDLDKGQRLQKELTEEVNEWMQTELFYSSFSNPNQTGFAEDLTQPASQEKMGEESVKEIAFSHAGVTADQVFLEKCKLDYEKGILVYEIEFQSGGYEYDYNIHASTGEIINYKKETAPYSLYANQDSGNQTSKSQDSGNGNQNSESQNSGSANQSSESQNSGNVNQNSESQGSGAENQTTISQNGGIIEANTGTGIGEEQAKTAAFSHAGVSADSVWLEKCRLDYEDGILVYEIEFYSDSYEYEYDINAQTGDVINFKKEMEHRSHTTLASQGNGTESSEGEENSYISESEAIQIARTRSGLDGVNGWLSEVELDYENGIMVYEVKIISAGYKHKCEIHAVTGEILSYKREKIEIDD